VTEDEAKTKWCPFARCESGAFGSGATAINRSAHMVYTDEGGLPNESLCLGSACMAWRDAQRAFRWTAKDEPAPGPDWTKTSETPFHTQWEGPREGFCGLAGQP
jgi:hypothetical protein